MKRLASFAAAAGWMVAKIRNRHLMLSKEGRRAVFFSAARLATAVPGLTPDLS
ncbi:hypothetical protein ACF8MD_32225 [Pseudomonas sp. zjy_8]